MGAVRELVPIVKEAFQKTAGFAKALCYLHVISTYVGRPVSLYGPSMLPTFDHNIVFAESISPRFGKVGSGDIVIFRSPEHPTKLPVKRIKAVEGDVVSYLPDPKSPDEIKTVVVPKGHVWVEGDNMHDSRDSRHFGAVPYAHIESRILFVVSNSTSLAPIDMWPPKDIKFTRNNIL